MQVTFEKAGKMLKMCPSDIFNLQIIIIIKKKGKVAVEKFSTCECYL